MPRIKLVLAVFHGLVAAALAATACTPAGGASPAASGTAPPAADLPVLSWRENRPLAWPDFRGQVPRDRLDESAKDRFLSLLPFALATTHEAAETASSIRTEAYRYTYECAHQEQTPRLRCRLTHIDVGAARAEFDPNRSWAIPDDETPRLLRHEQGHFDIAALYARKMQSALGAALSPLVGSVRADGDDQTAVDGAVKRTVGQVASRAREEVIRQFAAEQARYDRETAHGTDSASQDRWSARLDGDLKASPEHRGA